MQNSQSPVAAVCPSHRPQTTQPRWSGQEVINNDISRTNIFKTRLLLRTTSSLEQSTTPSSFAIYYHQYIIILSLLQVASLSAQRFQVTLASLVRCYFEQWLFRTYTVFHIYSNRCHQLLAFHSLFTLGKAPSISSVPFVNPVAAWETFSHPWLTE